VLPIAIALLAVAVVWPTFAAGWFGDDAFYANLHGTLAADGESLGAAIGHAFALWFWGNGRIYPLAIVEKYAVFDVFTSLAAYKALLIVLTVSSIEVFRRTVCAYSQPGFANVSALAAVALLQQRGYHDATLAYNGMLQIVVIGVFGAAWCMRRSIVLGSRADALAGAGLYAIAALTYEAAYPLCVLFVVAARAAGCTWRRAFAVAAPYLTIGIGLALASALARHVQHLAAGSPYGFVLSVPAIVRTSAIQIAAALPLSYVLFDPSGIFSRDSLRALQNSLPVQPLFFLAFAITAWVAARGAARAEVNAARTAAIGLGLLVLPALPLALVAKYQHELRWGLGYLPVFVQIFGVALLLAVAFVQITRRFRHPAVAGALVFVLAVCATLTSAANVRLGRELQSSTMARASLERALDAGLLRALSDGASIHFAQPFDWVTPNGAGPDGLDMRGLFFAHGGRRVSVVAGNGASAVLFYDRAAGTWSVNGRPDAGGAVGQEP
jgi:hypothetical protein